jgi:C4-dicarboxylate-specific signal transduction histidine kinase
MLLDDPMRTIRAVARDPRPTPSHPADEPIRARSLPVLGPFFDSRPIRPVMIALHRPGLLTGMRVRKKLIVLHTLFTLLLATVLVVTLRPAVGAVVREAELDKAMHVLSAPGMVGSMRRDGARALDHVAHADVRIDTATALGIDPETLVTAVTRSGEPLRASAGAFGRCVLVHLGRDENAQERFVALNVRIPEVRAQVARVYLVASGALLGMYVLVATALEVLVLPQNVYRPIRRVLDADDALQRGDRRAEMIHERDIPRDELGEIMRSRNESVARLRTKERELAHALARLEQVAGDLKKKNHLLEAAQRNLADADRLAALGIMSAGIAHELNTPLAVVKGLAERLYASGGTLSESDAALLVRVVGRLERLGESLLDYARVRPPRCEWTALRPMIEEAIALVRLDRGAEGVRFDVVAEESLGVACDADRIVQVLLNLIRNAVDALRELTGSLRDPALIEVVAASRERDGKGWLTVLIRDNGPGIDPRILPSLFEPFASTRLDSTGAGLGLAVADGIVREHGGVLLARNRAESTGAEFEIMLPINAQRGAELRQEVVT